MDRTRLSRAAGGTLAAAFLVASAVIGVNALTQPASPANPILVNDSSLSPTDAAARPTTEPAEAVEPTETAEATEPPEATESPEATEKPEATDDHRQTANPGSDDGEDHDVNDDHGQDSGHDGDQRETPEPTGDGGYGGSDD